MLKGELYEAPVKNPHVRILLKFNRKSNQNVAHTRRGNWNWILGD
jgi:hypothetical protein